jgi:hypothetical protein
MKKTFKNWHRPFSLIGIILFIFILSKTNLGSFLLIFKQAKYSYFIFLPISIFSIFFVQTVKWQRILEIQKLNYNFWYLFRVTIVSTYYALLTPSRVGYFVKIGYLDASPGTVGSSVIVDRILDTLVLIGFALIGASLLINQFPNLIFQILIFAFAFFILILFFYSKKRAKFLFSFFKKIIPFKFHHSLKKIFHDFYDNLPHQGRLLFPFLLTILTWFLIYSQTYLIARALRISIDFWHFVFYFPIATIVGLIPITISGLGTREAALILLFSQFNVSIESIVALSLGALVLTAYLPALYGVFLSLTLRRYK